MAAPTATTSSGLSRPCAAPCRTAASRPSPGPWASGVMPPTRTTSSISAAESPASLSACRHGSTVFCTRSSTSASNLARVSFIVRCLGPDASAVTNGRLISRRLGGRGQFDPWPSRPTSFQPPQRQLVAAQIDALLLLELVGLIADQAVHAVGNLQLRPGRCRRWWTSPRTRRHRLPGIETSKVPPPRS